MKSGMKFYLVVSFANISLASLTIPNSLHGLKTKRALLSCLETYGGGSITCGGADSLFCYDPALGDTCCAMDNGYCKSGDFCAPVAGFCCTIGEDPETCAVRLDFNIPAASSTKTQTTISSSTLSVSAASAIISTLTSPKLLTSTSTIRVELASATPKDSVVSNLSVPYSALDTGGMTAQFTAPVGNNMAPEYTAPVNTTSSVVATKTASGNLLAYTGAGVMNKMNDVCSALGLLVAFGGLAL